MKRFGSFVLFLAILVSIGIHFLLFRMLIFQEETVTSEPRLYEVTLKYKKKLPAPQKERQGKGVKKRKIEEKIIEEKDDTLVQEHDEDTEEEMEDPAVIEDEQVLREEVADQEDAGSVAEERGQRYDRAVAELREKIIGKKVYPQAARRRDIEGVVLIFLELDAAGESVELRVLESSGSRILDGAALSLIEKVIPFEHGLEGGLSVEIPIRYNLEE